MRVIILGKAPMAGRVKTRLMPEYSAEEAAKLHTLMMQIVLEKACACFEHVWLAADDIHHEVIKSLVSRFKVELHAQAAGDLGNRLQKLMYASFDMDDEPIMFLGTDSPHVGIQRYKDAEAALVRYDIVIGAVEDGGYDLIALKQNTPELFDNIDWGSESVLTQTLNHIKALGLDAKVLHVLFDLDRPEDLKRAPPSSWL